MKQLPYEYLVESHFWVKNSEFFLNDFVEIVCQVHKFKVKPELRQNCIVIPDFQIRHTARILLVDQLDRLLLFKIFDPVNSSDFFWCPVGGGIEEGESPAEAAKREVAEETGLMDFELGPHIWNRQARYTFNGNKVHTKESWFFSRVAGFEIDISGFSEIEHKSFVENRWWTSEELFATNEHLTPRALPSLFGDLLLNGAPTFPLELELEEHF